MLPKGWENTLSIFVFLAPIKPAVACGSADYLFLKLLQVNVIGPKTKWYEKMVVSFIHYLDLPVELILYEKSIMGRPYMSITVRH